MMEYHEKKRNTCHNAHTLVFMFCTGFAINITMISIETQYTLNCWVAQIVVIVGQLRTIGIDQT